jgi:uroporphyrinogen decarboxylase
MNAPIIETLTSRERVVRTLNREPVDRMPIDLGAHPSSGISAFAYKNLREHLGLDPGKIWVHDTVQMLACVDEDIRRRFHIDTIQLEPEWPTLKPWSPRPGCTFQMPTSMPLELTPQGDWIVQRNNQQMRLPAGGYFFDGDWLCDWGGLGEDEAIALYAREAERIHKETEYATMFSSYSYGGGFGAFFGGIDRAVEMLDEPDRVKEEHEALLATYIRRAGKAIDAFGPSVQMISIGDDMGMQSGPMCRPSVLEDCTFPYIKRFCDFIHRHSDWKVFLHSCGSIRALIPLMIEAGIDVLNPVQISAADMDPSGLKRDFGDRIIFWGGGCDTQNVLGSARPEQVRENVHSLVSTFNQDGGFVFNQVHNIMGDVPPENVVAMLDAAYEVSTRKN